MNASMNTFCMDCGEDYTVAESPCLPCYCCAVCEEAHWLGIDTLSHCIIPLLGMYRLWSSIIQWGSQKTGQTRCRAPISTPKTKGPHMSTTCRSGRSATVHALQLAITAAVRVGLVVESAGCVQANTGGAHTGGTNICGTFPERP